MYIAANTRVKPEWQNKFTGSSKERLPSMKQWVKQLKPGETKESFRLKVEAMATESARIASQRQHSVSNGAITKFASAIRMNMTPPNVYIIAPMTRKSFSGISYFRPQNVYNTTNNFNSITNNYNTTVSGIDAVQARTISIEEINKLQIRLPRK